MTAAGAQAIHPVMVGTAGHIDHGKSSLVLALTGIDPDRLKEEKERGLTIDLGFARMKLRDGRMLGIIDVPGHERFVRNMVAGSTALDLAILVVAADDGVMPQTLEHLDILDLLGVRCGLVALTKVDLVDEEIASLAQSEIEELIAGTALAGSEVIRVSTVTGQGVKDVKRAIERLAVDTVPRPSTGHFRMPVQRVFQLKGIGTVVTGIPVSGAVEPSDSVAFLPGEHVSKVRAVQAFGSSVERAVAGHSAALSVPDARSAGLRRGMVAAEPGIFQVGDAVDIELRLLARVKPIRHRREVRFHAGTSEAQGTLLLLDDEVLRGGEQTVARVALAEEICCAPGDRFLLRLQNPAITIGGGTVLRLLQSPRRYRRRRVGEELERLQAAGTQIESRVVEELALAGPAGLTPAELAARLARDPKDAEKLIAEHADVHVHARSGRAFLQSVLDEGIEELGDSVTRMLRSKPMAASVQRSAVRPTRTLPAALLDAVFDELVVRGEVRPGTQGKMLFVDRLAPLPAAEQARLDRLVEHCEAAGFRPPAREELAAAVGESPDVLAGLLARAEDEERLAPVGDHVYGAKVLRRAMASIVANCMAHDEVLDIPALRDELGTSRKYLIPLLEHVDGLGLTRLRGGVRVLLRSSALFEQLGG